VTSIAITIAKFGIQIKDVWDIVQTPSFCLFAPYCIGELKVVLSKAEQNGRVKVEWSIHQGSIQGSHVQFQRFGCVQQ
jgi:hypothetical protein